MFGQTPSILETIEIIRKLQYPNCFAPQHMSKILDVSFG